MKQMLRCKPLEILLQQAESKTGLRRTLGALDVTLMGIGVIVGTGIFVLTGHAAANNAGPSVALSFIVAGVAAALAGLCYSEMASMIPVAGSAYTYAYATIGEIAAFLIGWDLILEYLVGASTVAVGWSGYLVALIYRLTGVHLSQAWTQAPMRWDEAAHRFASTGFYINLPAVLFALGITAILIVGVRQSARLNAVMVAVKMTAILLFLGFAAAYVQPENWVPFIPENQGVFGKFGPSGVLQGATMVFFAYVGFDAISTIAQETRKPQRDLPIGMLGSLVICTLLYIAVSMVLTGVVPYSNLSVPHPIALGIAVTQRPWLEVVVAVGALAGLTSGALVMLLGQPRIFLAMAQDGLFPRFAQRVHPRFGTPHITTAMTGAACAVAGGVLPIEVLGELTSIGTLFAFVLVSLSVMVLRLKRPDQPRKFKVPGGPFLVPLLSAGVSGGLMFTATSTSLFRLFGWMAVGFVLYAVYGMRNSRLRGALAQNS